MQPIISEAHGPLVFVPAFPTDYKGPVLSGSQALSCTGDFGSIVVQDFAGESFNIRYIILRLFHKLVLHRIEEEKLRAQFVLQEHLKYRRDQATFQLKTNEYNLVWAPGKETMFHFKGEKEYHLLHVYYEPELIRQLIPTFPEPDSTPNEKDIHVIKPQSRDAIDQILTVPYKGDIRRFYYENQVRDLLFHMLFSEKEQKNISGLSEEEIAQVNRVEQIILRDLTVHYTIPELARKAKMGQFRLKTAFKLQNFSSVK